MVALELVWLSLGEIHFLHVGHGDVFIITLRFIERRSAAAGFRESHREGD